MFRYEQFIQLLCKITEVRAMSVGATLKLTPTMLCCYVVLLIWWMSSLC